MTPDRLVLAHGFTQNVQCWGPFVSALNAVHDLTLVDLPGHGESTDDEVTLDEAGVLLAGAAEGGVHLGYSLGGRTALHAAVRRPASVDALILIGATAGIVDPGERAMRADRDLALAETLLAHGLEPFLDRWLANPMFSGITPEHQFRAERLANRPEGLAASLRHRSTGRQEPLHDELSAFRQPVLILAGENDDKFVREGTDLSAAFGPNATLRIVPGTGHACHLESPLETADIILDWLKTL